jgi:hypothetical protein
MLQVVEPLSHQPHLMRISFHIKLKFSPKMILILIQCQMRRVMRTLWPIKYREPCIWGSLHGLRDFLLLLRVPYRMPCRQLTVKEKIQLVLGFTLCLRDWTPTTLACNRDLMKIFHLKLKRK